MQRNEVGEEKTMVEKSEREWSGDGSSVQNEAQGNGESGGSDTKPPPVGKPGGLGEGKRRAVGAHGSDTDPGSKAKTGLNES